MSERAQFPGAEMTCKEQDASPAGRSDLVILVSVICDNLIDVFAAQFWELRELSKQSSHVKENRFNNRPAFGRAQVRHRHFEVTQADAPQPAMKVVRGSGQQSSHKERKSSGHQGKQVQNNPCRDILEHVFESASFSVSHDLNLTWAIFGVKFGH